MSHDLMRKRVRPSKPPARAVLDMWGINPRVAHYDGRPPATMEWRTERPLSTSVGGALQADALQESQEYLEHPGE